MKVSNINVFEHSFSRQSVVHSVFYSSCRLQQTHLPTIHVLFLKQCKTDFASIQPLSVVAAATSSNAIGDTLPLGQFLYAVLIFMIHISCWGNPCSVYKCKQNSAVQLASSPSASVAVFTGRQWNPCAIHTLAVCSRCMQSIHRTPESFLWQLSCFYNRPCRW